MGNWGSCARNSELVSEPRRKNPDEGNDKPPL